MRTPRLFRPLVFGVVGLIAQPLVALAAADVPALQLPPGYSVSTAAAAPLVRYPMMAAFDDRGRLFVAENAGVNLDADALLRDPPSRVLMLEDTDGDGTFDRSTVFADKLTFPQGVLWHDGALYVASPPSIWRLEDTDGDGRADRRTEIVTGFKFTGNAADVHGPFLHPNGRLYWCHGRKGHEVRQRDGTLVSRALGARIWSCRPDGSDIRVHAGGGMDNPTEVAFSQEGEIFGTANIFHASPRSDAVVHWVRGGVYPRADQEPVIAEFPRTGDLLAPAALLGHVAPAGLMVSRQAAGGGPGDLTLYHAEFNPHRIMRLSLRTVGSTFRGEPEVFALSSDPNVHFTDVLEDADGSLLVIDTGAWFRIGCPTSGVARPEILGRVLRIRAPDATVAADPRGLALPWQRLDAAGLAALLGNSRPVVRDRAVATLARLGDAAVPALQAALRTEAYLGRSNAVWTLTRIATPAAQAALRSALEDRDARVRQAACHGAGLTADRAAVAALIVRLQDDSALVRREAAQALGQVGASAALAPLAGVAAGDDAALAHALVLSLLEIGSPDEILSLLPSASPAGRRSLLLALDRLAPARVPAAEVFRALRDGDAAVRAAALGLALRHPAWGVEAADYLKESMSPELRSARRELAGKILAGFIRAAAVRSWLVGSGLAAMQAWGKETVFAALATTADAWDEAWRPWVAAALRAGTRSEAEAALRVIAVQRKHGFTAELGETARAAGRPVALRVAALQLAAGPGRTLDAESFALLVSPWERGGTTEERQQAAIVLGASTLDRAQMMRVIALVPALGPLELAPVAVALSRGPADAELGERMLAAWRQASARFGVAGSVVQGVFRRFPEPVVVAAAPLVSEVMNAAAAKDSRVIELEKLAESGDAERGRAAFLAGTGACLTCHRVGADGGRVGPELSRIGAIRTRRDLVESIAFPSATLARGYETFQVERTGAEPLVGLVPRETAESLVVVTADGRETVVPRAAVTRQDPLAVSLMPPGLDRSMPPQTLADLVAFLLAQR
jgi:putative membrane-bound dehydrogenase-like protein